MSAPGETPARGPQTAAHGGYAVGETIGAKYRLARVLGEGGMGCVWQAHSEPLDVDVAVKLIKGGAASAEAAQRLLLEARAAARIGHASIVRVMDYGETDRGDPYIVMELLAGETLGELIHRKQKLAAARAVRTVLPIASALAAAHEAGIVHRDLKPDNVILTPDGSSGVVPKLVDFGIAKLRRPGAADLAITRAGDILGSVDYMSPEQARGTAEVDERTDGWALCVIAYEAITGKRPFRGKNDDAILSAILLDDPAPPSELGVDDEGLWAILSRGLEKSPDLRWPSVRALGKALASWALERGVEHDVAGTSLAAHWLGRNPVTDELPPEAQELAELDHAELVARVKRTPASDAASAQAATSPEPDPPAPRVPIARAPWAAIVAAIAFVAVVAAALTRC